jgi:hypothetical protein
LLLYNQLVDQWMNTPPRNQTEIRDWKSLHRALA